MHAYRTAAGASNLAVHAHSPYAEMFTQGIATHTRSFAEAACRALPSMYADGTTTNASSFALAAPGLHKVMLAIAIFRFLWLGLVYGIFVAFGTKYLPYTMIANQSAATTQSLAFNT